MARKVRRSAKGLRLSKMFDPTKWLPNIDRGVNTLLGAKSKKRKKR